MAIPVFNPRLLAERGEEIYRRKFKGDFESRHKGEFVAIDVDGERAFSGNTPDDAMPKHAASFRKEFFIL